MRAYKGNNVEGDSAGCPQIISVELPTMSWGLGSKFKNGRIGLNVSDSKKQRKTT